MTELFIDGVSAVLPKDFSIAVKRENPMFTKNGEYTYDITLQLTNPTNAKLYEHLNRLNSVTEVKSERTAILRADNRVYCNGTEVITGWTDDTVSIQIASGNSELNYFIGADKKIEELEMRQTTVPTAASGRQTYITSTYPDVDYCLTPVFNQTDDRMYNAWYFAGQYDVPSPISDSEYIPQPYLLAYIKEVLAGLGYTLTTNQLTDTVFKDLYLCHAWNTDKWNEMLPGWTVLDFLTQIEQLFDAVFVVDNKTKSASLLFRGRYLAGADTAHVRWVTDVYEAEVEEEPDIEDMAQANVSYNLPSDDSWKFACLSEEVKNLAKRDVIPADYQPSGGYSDRVSGWFRENEANRKTDTIFTDEITGIEYLFIETYMSESGREEHEVVVFNMVDRFANLAPQNAVTDIELDIIPVTMAQATVELSHGADEEIPKEVTCWLPKISEGTDSEEETGKTLADIIREGVSKPSSSSLTLAFYSGLTTLCSIRDHGTVYQCKYPVPYVDEYTLRPYTDNSGEESSFYIQTNSVGASLRLETLNELIYQANYDIDYKHGIKLSSYDPNVYDPMAVFEIRNKRYVCKEIEYTLDANGRKGAWTGTFYPIKLSDTEADLRWILADGKWRDGGVWLDNGRWLDS